ncbi:MAG: sigma-70 family RNA polymerase sigma factor [Labilithrix sp.]|nr:sigma-70 family RNA polymerase sigma factor [Labilithrix sp.]MBX3223955.1 sigma-70 family RNA polymerase sigma factor [Labilithrix sp.]
MARLFEEHAAFVARSLRRLGVLDRDVDDGLQEVFLIAQSKLDAIEAGKERSFLFGIARRRASSLRRSVDRASRRDMRSLEEQEVEAPHESEKLTEEEHARAMLDEVLDALPLDLRTVLVLHELEEIETAEIAELLGIPVGTVASRLRRAREKFEIEADRMRARLAAED